MSKSERKQEQANQPATILFSENSELLPVTRQKLVKLREILKQDKLTPWLWFNSRGVEVTKFNGGIISIQGVLYEQSAPNVFWNFIEPFLQDAIVKNLDETLETCRARGLKPEEPYIRETASLLDGYLIDPIYRYMADIDRRIRGKGNPESVGHKDVTDQITEMVTFLDKCKDEMIQGIKAKNKLRDKAGDMKKPQENDGQGKTDTQGHKASKPFKVPVSKLIEHGEGHSLEFKETLEYDTQKKGKNKDILLSSLKTIAGFLNAEGGTLLIGVDDSGKTKGIERDFSIMRHCNNDKFQQKIRSFLRERFEPQPIGKIDISFEKLDEGTVCQVDVQASEDIIHLNNEVYVREGNTTQRLVGRALTNWSQKRKI